MIRKIKDASAAALRSVARGWMHSRALATLRRFEGAQRYALILAGDLLATTFALYLAFLLRFEGRIPPERVDQFLRCLVPLLVIRGTLGVAFGTHRWSFRLSGIHEGMRLVHATLTGSVCFATAFYFVQRAAEDVSIGPPRSVIVIEFLLTTVLIGLSRFSIRVSEAWGATRLRARGEVLVRTVIVGAGSAGELLLRDLERSDEHNYQVLGFVDDAPKKRGTTIGGRPVLGTLHDLPDVARRWRAELLLFAIPRLPAEQLRSVLDSCAELKLAYKILPVSFAYLHDRMTVSMLQDLAPDDLLPRSPVSFDQEAIRAQIRGKRVLVTGAAGSIGSEICRQLARHEPASLVLADINENGLYFLFRHLQRVQPTLSAVPEVVDVRDPARLRQLAEHHRPHLVLHAAAHKHVPLMENNPEEAVKNNVLACRNVLEMAHGSGAERFVLISTDKAVNPSSVMGATKRLAEMLVGDWSRRSPTSFAIVRFGNVLGSAGSVVPLFKLQIARGGPVTVTHPECRRFLMTIREAVGLTLLAGLEGERGLFVLEMGEPIRVLDLARSMITLAGKVPERDIPIVITGLRPGEKLDEQLMSAEEARSSRRVRDGIFAVESPVAPADLRERVETLERLAADGDRAGVLAALRETVPGYVPGTEAEGVDLPAPFEEEAFTPAEA
jgi:FlaA1/EpsC-like NDP-sugar epimerase